MGVISKPHKDIKNINLGKISEAELGKEVAAKTQRTRAETSPPLQ